MLRLADIRLDVERLVPNCGSWGMACNAAPAVDEVEACRVMTIS
jgi:hypothetical protein